MRSHVWFFLPLLGGFAQSAYAQNNSELSPFVDSRVGGVSLNFGRGSVDNDGDLLVARELFDPNFGTQSLYFRTHDGTNDTERMHFDVILTGATVQNTVSDTFLLRVGDQFVSVGDVGDYDTGGNTGRGLEGGDTIVRAANNRSFGAAFTNGGGIDDFRAFVSFDDLDPGNNVNRGSAFAALTLYAGGAKSPLLGAFPSGTNLGIRVGETDFDSITGDGDYIAGFNLEPEGNGGFNSPATTQGPIVLVLLFEDVDISQSLVAFPLTDPGASTGAQSYTVDNFAQGVDLDGDNFADTNGSIEAVPNLSLERIVFVLPDLIGPNGAVIPKSAIQAATNLGSLAVGESNAFNVSVNIPANAAPGTYTGQALAFEDNNNNGVFDANETGDTVTLQVQVRQLVSPDTDNDGLLDIEEDFDSDGVLDPGETNPNDVDTDNDTLNDGIEVLGQNPTDPRDGDSDDDGIIDGTEDLNKNGIFEVFETNPNDADTDNDTLDDGVEDANHNASLDDGETNPRTDDSDSDGLKDNVEINGQNPTNPLDFDSDNDGLFDGIEDTNQNGQKNGNETDPNDADTDNGGEPDGSEVVGNRDPLNPADDLIINPNGDDDNDGLTNILEDKNDNGVVDPGETDPNNPDSDQDALSDGVEDTDHDGLQDDNETSPIDNDSDDDALLDGTEVLGDNSTDPLNADSDGDGLQDGCEDLNKNGAFNNNELNPNLTDTDDDGLPDSSEDTNGNCSLDAGETDGTSSDTDGGGELDGSEVDGGRDPLNPDDDLRGPVSLYEIGGGSCAVQPSGASSLWMLLGFGLWLLRRQSRYAPLAPNTQP